MGEPLSGKDGTINKDGSPVDVDVLGWDFDAKGNEQRFASDKTSGHKVVYLTVKDFDAKVRVKIPLTGNLPFNRGDQFTIKLHGDDSGNNYIEAPVTVLSNPIPCDITEGQNSEVEYTLGPTAQAVFHGIYWGGAGSSGV